MDKNYLYKVKCGDLKKGKLLDFGFREFDAEGEKLYARPVRLAKDSKLVQGLINIMNDKRWQEEVDFEDLEKDGFNFLEDIDTGEKTLILNDFVWGKLCKAQICVSCDDMSGCLFLNSPDATPYYNIEILNEYCKEIIDKLLSEGIIYKKLCEKV